MLFDAAGTLIALREPVGESYARIAGEHGVAISAWRLGEAFGRSLRRAPPLIARGASDAEIAEQERAWWRDVVRSTFRAADCAETERFADFEACFAQLWDLFARPEAWTAREGAREALAVLRERGVATAVVSNFDGRLPRILDGLGLAPLLDAIVLPSQVGAAKPDAAIFRAGLERLGVAAHEAVFVGDDPEEDLAPARRCGLRAIDARQLATLAELPDRLTAPGAVPAEESGE